MKSIPMTKIVLHILLVVLFLFLPCLALADEPQPTITVPAPPSSPPTLRACSGSSLGGQEGERGVMEFKAG